MILRALGKALIINSERFKTVMCWSEDFENFLRIRINFELYWLNIVSMQSPEFIKCSTRKIVFWVEFPGEIAEEFF